MDDLTRRAIGSLGSRRARLVVWVAGALPAVWLGWQLWRALQGEPHTLGREPVKGLEHRTGDLALRFLAASLAVSPLRRLAGWNWLAPYRRVLGLLAFGYASAHLLVFAALDLELDFGDVAREVAKRPYITIGFTAWLLLVPLAATSTRGAIRRLGARWVRLHRLVYLVAPLAVVHFWWSQKKDHSSPLAWGLVFAALLAWRLLRWWRRGSPATSRPPVPRAAGSGPTPPSPRSTR